MTDADSPAGRESWGSKVGFLLAAAGSAVGLGNIWRFTYIMGDNGGAAFIALYVVCICAVGVPVFLAELAIGRASRRNPVGAFRRLSRAQGSGRAWVAVGVMGVTAGFLALSFYSVVGGWVIYYVFASLRGFITALSGTPAAAEMFAELSREPGMTIALHAVFMLLTVAVVARGVRGGLERASKLLMPLLVLILLLLIVRGISLPGASAGVDFLLAPDWSALSARSLLLALGHAFFTLSVGMGAMITYGSYLPADVDMPRATAQVAVFDTLIAVAAGFAIFPALFAFGLPPAQGPGLIFVTLPAVFAAMPGGEFFALLFFVLVLLAAITSSISMLEVVTSYLVDERGWNRSRAAWGLGAAIFVAGAPAALSVGPLSGWSVSSLWLGRSGLSGIGILDMNWFDLVSHVVSDYMLSVGGICMAVFVGWYWRRVEVVASLGPGAARFRLLGLWLVLLRWVVPAVVLEVLVLGLLGEFHEARFPAVAAAVVALRPWFVGVVLLAAAGGVLGDSALRRLGSSERYEP